MSHHVNGAGSTRDSWVVFDNYDKKNDVENTPKKSLTQSLAENSVWEDMKRAQHAQNAAAYQG